MQVGPGPQLQTSIMSVGLGASNNMQNENFGPSEDSVSFSSPSPSSAVQEGPWKRFTNWLTGKKSSGQNSSVPPWLAGIGGLLIAGTGVLLFKKFRVPKPHSSSSGSSWNRSPEDIRTLDAPKQPLLASNAAEIKQLSSVDSTGKVKQLVGPHEISIENGYAHEWVTLVKSPEGMTALKESILKSLKAERHMGNGSFAQAFTLPLRARDAEKNLVFDQPVLRVDKLGKNSKKLTPLEVQNKLFASPLTTTGKTHVQSSYRVVPIKYESNAKGMLEDKNLGLPFAVIVPKGHAAYDKNFVGLEELEKVRGSLLRRVGGKDMELNKRPGVYQFADVLSRSTYLETKIKVYASRINQAEIKLKTVYKRADRKKLEDEIAALRVSKQDVTAEFNRTNKYALVRDLHTQFKTNPTQPNLEIHEWNSLYGRQSTHERKAYDDFVTKYMKDIKTLGDMPQATVDGIIQSLKNIDAAGAKVDYSHGANMFYDAAKKDWTFIDLALSKAEKGEISTLNEKGEWVKTVHTSQALSLNNFVDVALGKSSWGPDFLPSKYVQGNQRKEMQASMESFLSKLENAAQTHHINHWDANEIRKREGLI